MTTKGFASTKAVTFLRAVALRLATLLLWRVLLRALVQLLPFSLAFAFALVFVWGGLFLIFPPFSFLALALFLR